LKGEEAADPKGSGRNLQQCRPWAGFIPGFEEMGRLAAGDRVEVEGLG